MDRLRSYVSFELGYDLSSAKQGLYRLPSPLNKDELRSRTKQKLQAVVASAVANTEGKGEREGGGANTYLLLGPIGTGAFGNDIEMIAELFSEILNQPLMGSEGPIRYAFEEIWFVSIDSLVEFKAKFETRQSEIVKELMDAQTKQLGIEKVPMDAETKPMDEPR